MDESWRVECLDRDFEEIVEAASNDTSQFGEDGLIDFALKRIGEANRWCFEVGAADGVQFSNTYRLREQGWSAVLIEQDETLFKQLASFATAEVRVFHGKVGPGCQLDDVLDLMGCSEEPDLGVIDVDGQDIWLLEDLRVYHPRLLLVEYCPTAEDDYVPARGADFMDQAGFGAIVGVARSKGYRPIARTHVNVLFAGA